MALTALRKYALADKNRAIYKMTVSQKISSLQEWEPTIWIAPDNYSTLSQTVVCRSLRWILTHAVSSTLNYYAYNLSLSVGSIHQDRSGVM